MKHITLTLVFYSLLAGCAAWPGMEDPGFTLAPQLVLLKVTGKAQMQSITPPFLMGVQDVDNFGAGERDEDLGLRLAYGDGFSGFEAEYMLVDMQSTEVGRTIADWGTIPSGTDVNSKLFMDDIRLRYIAGLIEWNDEDEERYFKAGLGVQLAHRELNFTVRDIGSTNAQRIEIKEDLSPMLAVRLSGGSGAFDVTFDGAINDDWALGTGDFDKRFYDISIKASYYLEAQDLTLFGGYRRFDVPSRGFENTLEYRTDFTFDGLFFGFQVVF